MKVSAIIVTYNRLKFIRRAIDSVLAQTIPVDEIIVVDDGSTDGTAAAIGEWFGPAVKVVRQENGGVGVARRTGVLEATGDWIAFLDSDDEWVPNRTERFLEAARRVPAEVAWIFGDLQLVKDDSDTTTLFQQQGLRVGKDLEVFADSLTVQYPFQFGLLQGSWMRRQVLVELGCFSEGFRSDEDLLAGFQIACRYKVAAIPDVVGKYYQTSDLATSSLALNGSSRPEYFQARMLAFECVIKTGRQHPWNLRYAAEVRGLCKNLAVRGTASRRLALQQFRYGGYSLKGIGFLLAAMLGRRGIQAWEAVGQARRGRGGR